MNADAFNRRPSAAMRAAEEGPVIVTTRGKPTHVLMTYLDYQRLLHGRGTVPAILTGEFWDEVAAPDPQEK